MSLPTWEHESNAIRKSSLAFQKSKATFASLFNALTEMAALKERTSIAGEVQDTVGHTLTTAIVALEGAQLLFEKRPEEAYRKILIAREQMKQGLGNIRQVVKM